MGRCIGSTGGGIKEEYDGYRSEVEESYATKAEVNEKVEVKGESVRGEINKSRE